MNIKCYLLIASITSFAFFIPVYAVIIPVDIKIMQLSLIETNRIEHTLFITNSTAPDNQFIQTADMASPIEAFEVDDPLINPESMTALTNHSSVTPADTSNTILPLTNTILQISNTYTDIPITNIIIIAILDFEPQSIPPSVTEQFTENLRRRLDENENIQVFDEDDIRAMLAVQGMENEFCDVLSCAVTIVRLVNCNKVILGSISQSNGIYIMNSYVVNVSNEMIDYHHNLESQNTELLEAAVQPLANSISHKIENELRGNLPPNDIEREVIHINNENSTLQVTARNMYRIARAIDIDFKRDIFTINIGLDDGITVNDKISVSVPVARTIPGHNGAGQKEIIIYRQIGWLDVIEADASTCRARLIGGGKYSSTSGRYLFQARNYVVQDMGVFYDKNICEKKL